MSNRPDTVGYHKRTMSGKRIYLQSKWRPYAQTHRRTGKRK